MSSSSSPSTYRIVGIILALSSGVLIGTSFVFKKKGLLKSQAGHAAGEGVAYLKSPMWWTGMIMMICGELCNFGAYAFVEAIVVTPLGALSVVISAILSHLILKEKLTLFGWIGCVQCILGSIIIALNGPQEQSVSTIEGFKKLFIAPWFLAYGGVCIAAVLVIIFFVAPKYGKRSMIWYILVCSLIGGISVSCTQGLGACILTSIRGDNQFKNGFIYFLMIFVVCTLLAEIYYLNVALALFNTAMVTPTYYVLFTFCTLVTSVILYQGLKAPASTIVTIVLAFLVICTGIFILQMSKIDPRRLTRLGRKTTMLLQAAREKVGPSSSAGPGDEDMDNEKLLEATEEPSMDALVGRFGGVSRTVIRARRRVELQNGQGRYRANTTASAPLPYRTRPSMQSAGSGGLDSIRARQLQELWREEWEEKRGADDTTCTQVLSADISSGDGKWVPMASSGTEPKCMLSSERLVSSPTESSMHGLRESPSVRFNAQSLRRSQSHPSNGHESTVSQSSIPALPDSPQPALLPNQNSSRPSLHLPAASLNNTSTNSAYR